MWLLLFPVQVSVSLPPTAAGVLVRACGELMTLCYCSSEVNLNYGRLYPDVRKQYLKLLSALVSQHSRDANLF